MLLFCLIILIFLVTESSVALIRFFVNKRLVKEMEVLVVDLIRRRQDRIELDPLRQQWVVFPVVVPKLFKG